MCVKIVELRAPVLALTSQLSPNTFLSLSTPVVFHCVAHLLILKRIIMFMCVTEKNERNAYIMQLVSCIHCIQIARFYFKILRTNWAPINGILGLHVQ